MNYESVDVESGQLIVSEKDFVMESACGLNDGSVLFLRNSIERPFLHHLWKLRTDPHTGKFLDAPRQFTHDDYGLNEISASPDGREVVAVRGVNAIRIFMSPICLLPANTLALYGSGV